MGEILKIEERVPQPEIGFSDFWTLYPRHEAKKDALKAWDKIDSGLHVTILEALYCWRREWQARDTKYIPLPASWLNGERWDDELPAGAKPMNASQSAPPDPGKRTAMPQYVRDMIAKLKK